MQIVIYAKAGKRLKAAFSDTGDFGFLTTMNRANVRSVQRRNEDGMEGEAAIEEFCEVAAEKLPHLLKTVTSPKSSENGGTMEFTEKDAANLQAAKAAMGEKAAEGDTAAAAAFAALLDAQTRREELMAKNLGQEKLPASPAAGGSWTESVGNRPVNLEVLSSAA
jgi:hypothetical protein